MPTEALAAAVRVSVPDAVPSGGGVNVPGPVIVIPDGVGPIQVAYVFTGDEKSLIEDTTILTDPLPLWESERDPDEDDSEKLGCEACEIVMVNVVAWLRLPLVPNIWKL